MLKEQCRGQQHRRRLSKPRRKLRCCKRVNTGLHQWRVFACLSLAFNLQNDESSEHSANQCRRKALLRWRDSARLAAAIGLLSDDLGAQRAASALRRTLSTWRYGWEGRSKLSADMDERELRRADGLRRRRQSDPQALHLRGGAGIKPELRQTHRDTRCSKGQQLRQAANHLRGEGDNNLTQQLGVWGQS